MKDYYIENIRKEIESLKEIIRNNFEIINSNLDNIKDLLKESDTLKRSLLIDIYYYHNQNLIEENKAIFKTQDSLLKILKVNFLEYAQTEVPKYISSNFDLYLKETIENKILFNQEHPYFRNIDFIERLIIYFEKARDYQTVMNFNYHLLKIKEDID